MLFSETCILKSGLSFNFDSLKKFETIQNHHYENMPMQYTVIFKIVKNENFQ